MSTPDDSQSNNPGTVLASAVNAETAKFRNVQTQLQQLHTDVQVVLSQATENEMVLQELQLIQQQTQAHVESNKKSPVYKLIGPVLLRQDVDEAVSTVQKRLEFIRSEQAKIQQQIQKKETEAQKLATSVQQMNQALQQSTVQAVQAIAAEHAQKHTVQ